MFIWLLAGSHASAALLAYEPFDYSAGEPIVSQENGLGFEAPWQPGGFNAKLFLGFRMKPGALTYPGLATRGSNHLSGEAPAKGVMSIAGVGRLLSTNLAVTGTKYYLSFLHRPDSEDGYSVIVLGSGQGDELAIGKPGAGQSLYYLTHRGGKGRVHSTVKPKVGTTAFIVVKMEFRERSDRFTLFVNPTPGKPEPGNGVVKEDLHLELANKLFLYSRGAWSVDEIRLGSTWQDVTPVAEDQADRPKFYDSENEAEYYGRCPKCHEWVKGYRGIRGVWDVPGKSGGWGIRGTCEHCRADLIAKDGNPTNGLRIVEWKLFHW